MERAFGKGKDLAMPSARPPPKRCPRCDSTNTKFCYFNNYSQSQPRHLCRDCRRYWTEGGTLRNVPQGGGSHHRKVKRSRKSSAGSSSSSDTFNPVNSTGLEAPVMPTTTTTAPPLPPVYLGEGMMALFQPFTATGPGPMMAFKQAQFSQPIQLPAGFVNIPIQAQMPPPPPPQFDPIMALPSRFGLREYQPMNSTDISQFTTGSGGTTASSGLNAAGGSGTDQDGFYWNINNQGDGGSPPRSHRRPPMP